MNASETPNALLEIDAASLQNSIQHGFHISDHIIIADSQHAESISMEVLSSCLISLGCAIMARSVQLNHQPRFMAKEIGHVCSERVLPTEFQSGQSARANLTPEHLFREG
jgi:hypothetical protein